MAILQSKPKIEGSVWITMLHGPKEFLQKAMEEALETGKRKEEFDIQIANLEMQLEELKKMRDLADTEFRIIDEP